MPRSDYTICTSEQRPTSTTVSHGFVVEWHSSPPFGSHGTCAHSKPCPLDFGPGGAVLGARGARPSGPRERVIRQSALGLGCLHHALLVLSAPRRGTAAQDAGRTPPRPAAHRPPGRSAVGEGREGRRRAWCCAARGANGEGSHITPSSQNRVTHCCVRSTVIETLCLLRHKSSTLCSRRLASSIDSLVRVSRRAVHGTAPRRSAKLTRHSTGGVRPSAPGTAGGPTVDGAATIQGRWCSRQPPRGPHGRHRGHADRTSRVRAAAGRDQATAPWCVSYQPPGGSPAGGTVPARSALASPTVPFRPFSRAKPHNNGGASRRGRRRASFSLSGSIALSGRS